MMQNVENNNNQGQATTNNDEIDLFELWNGLVAERLIIGLVTVVIIGIAALYAFWVSPTYKASTYYLPPVQEQVLPMNELTLLLDGQAIHTEESVFEEFQKQLSSRQTLKTIYDKYGLLKVYEPDIDSLQGIDKIKAENKAFEEYVADFRLIKPKKKSTDVSVSASFELELSELEVSKILNDLTKLAMNKTVQQLSGELEREKANRIRILESKIMSARTVEKDRRMDRIAKLDEAISISRKLNIKKPIWLDNNQMNTPQNQSAALYLLGYELLEAEKNVLLTRENDDAFIKGLRDWQQQLNQLNSLKFDVKSFGVVTVDQIAVYAEKVKPKKALILAVAGVFGLMLGVFIALIRQAVVKRRQVKSGVVT